MGADDNGGMRLAPMLATAAAALPEGSEWTYEVKWDGYRALAVKAGRRVELVSRNGKDLTRDNPTLVAAVADLKISDVVLDGEDHRRRRLKHLVAGSRVLVSEPLPGSPAHIEREIRSSSARARSS